MDVLLFGADIDECKEKTRCQCPDCQCANLWGGYACQCANDLLYIREHDTCISESPLPSRMPLHSFVAQSKYGVHFIFCSASIWEVSSPGLNDVINIHVPLTGKESQQSKVGWAVSLIILAGMAVFGVGAYIVYKYRLRVCTTRIILFF